MLKQKYKKTFLIVEVFNTLKNYNFKDNNSNTLWQLLSFKCCYQSW